MPRRARTLPALAAAMLAACGAPPPGSPYFPLDDGRRWTYDVKTEWDNDTIDHESLAMSSHGRDELDGGAAWRRRSDAGVDYWLRADDSGIYRVASKSDLDAEPRPDAQRRYVLKAPLVVGTSWQASTTAYLLRRRQDFPPEIRHTHPSIDMVYTIEAVGERLAARAGTFDDCVRVKGQAQLRLFADPVVGWRDLPLTTTEWYCKDVGLVRLVRQEPAQTTFLTGGTLTMELTTWR